MTDPRDAEVIDEPSGPSIEDAKQELDDHVEDIDTTAADLPDEVKDGEAEPGATDDQTETST
jgi:hypothetical protein